MEATILLLFVSRGKMEKEKKEENAKRIKCKEKKKEIRMKTNMTFSCFVFPVMKNSCKHK